MRLPTKTIERKLFNDGYHTVIGVDEVGMGCLAGPVVVCAVVFTRPFYLQTHRKLSKLRDSKLLLPEQREKFFIELMTEPDLRYQVSYCYPKTIDRLNIYQAARYAMRRAVKKLNNPYNKSFLLIDGDKKLQGISLEQEAIIKGDRKVFAIACASVIAKVFRDRMMMRYAKKFPGYGFEKHKGYSTKLHKAQLAVLGPSPIHRHSFAPVGKFL
ncbi:MAG: ribonuclease HII [Candidatus Yanofskybacteria bacterium]|nr:ribonuclease HII [Candidatus Yanofskybacteria bacterium]